MAFTVISDYVGEYNISQNRYANTDYTYIIASMEEKILKDLLGEDLYLKLIATPTVEPYLSLVNGKSYSVVNEEGVSVNVNYQGIKPMLKQFIYAELLKHQETQNSEVGQVEPLQNNSQRVFKNNLSKLISDAYNRGVNLYGFDIQTSGNSASCIRGLRSNFNTIKYTYQNYYKLLVKGSCFNYLYYCKENYPSYFPTWQFTEKDYLLMNGYL